MAKQKEAWDKLSMLEKALLIKLSVDNGVSSLKLIRDTYNLYANGGNLAHKKSGEELGESEDLNYPNLLPEVEVYPKWYDREWAKRTTAGMSAVGAGLSFVPNKYAKLAGTVLLIPDLFYDIRSLLVDPNTGNTVEVGLDLLKNKLFQLKVFSGLKGDRYKVKNLPLAIPGIINDATYAITGKSVSDINIKSTGGPLYPFSFEKNPYFKTPIVRYDEGGLKHDASNPGGYTNTLLAKNSSILGWYDPTGGLNFINYVLSLNFGNMARGEENEYWKEYLGLPSAVPLMNSNANTEWDKKIEQEKIAKGELASDFYGTTPRMDYNILALADTLMLGEMVRNYEKYDLEYNLPSIKSLTEAYELAKTILNNPNKWTLVDGEIPIGLYKYDPETSETNPLGMLANFGMKWVPEENALYMHDTYDFPSRVHKKTEIPVRPREMKIRSKINFDPTKGSWLLRSPVNYNTNIPAKITK